MAVYLLLAALVGFAAYVRLAPSDPGVWHVAPRADGPWGEVVADRRSATLRIATEEAGALLLRLDAVAMATPRTVRLAGSAAEGRITWVTRTKLWGFPDYTTAEARADGLYVYARNRFGAGDLGVNAARLRDWLARL